MRLVVLYIVLLSSCTEVFIPELSDIELELVAPGQSAEIYSSEVYFYWENIENATQYEFQVAKPSFDTLTQLIFSEAFEFNSKILSLDTGIYTWRVRAVNEGSKTEYSKRQILVLQNDSI